ncbi:hypothetical protein N665_0275s0056 [Sinapis alba]|nr:hypothetical protein N665_0275s0056 [Sinapis alba]
MEESAIRGVELNGSDAEIRESRISRIVVEGYDISLCPYDVEEALRKHFASCGNIIHVYVPINNDTDSFIPNRFSLIYLNGEDEEKALRLNGSDMGGRILQVYAYPFQEHYLDDVLATTLDCRIHRTLTVTGFDPSLSKDDVETKLCKHFYQAGAFAFMTCGGVKSTALVYAIGEDAVQMALELSGRTVEGLNIVVTEVVPQKPIKAGFSLIRSRAELARLAEEQKNEESKTTE